MNVLYSTVLVATSCGGCHIPFGLPSNLEAAARKDGRSFYCPNGHCISYSDTENKRLRREAADLERRVANLRDDVAVESAGREQAEHKARAHKAAHTRTKNRIHAGVCPHCKRSFPDVAAHMASKHPAAAHGGEGSTDG